MTSTSILASGSSALVVTIPEKPDDSSILMAAEGYAKEAMEPQLAPACFMPSGVQNPPQMVGPAPTNQTAATPKTSVIKPLQEVASAAPSGPKARNQDRREAVVAE